MDSSLGQVTSAREFYQSVASGAAIPFDEARTAVLSTTLATMGSLFLALSGFMVVAHLTSRRFTRALLSRQPAVDRSKVLANVGGDEALLDDVVALFLRDYPELKRDVENAITSADGDALRMAAHALRGVLYIFTDGGALDAALRLENMGRDNDLANADETFVAMEAEIDGILAEIPSLSENQGAHSAS